MSTTREIKYQICLKIYLEHKHSDTKNIQRKQKEDYINLAIFSSVLKYKGLMIIYLHI